MKDGIKNQLLAVTLKHAREFRKLTQQQMADKLGISRQTVSDYETGKSSLTFKQIHQISEVLDLDPFVIALEDANSKKIRDAVKLSNKLSMSVKQSRKEMNLVLSKWVRSKPDDAVKVLVMKAALTTLWDAFSEEQRELWRITLISQGFISNSDDV